MPWWGYAAGLALVAVFLLRVLPALVWMNDGIDLWPYLRHTLTACDPHRHHLGGFRCACGRAGASYDDFDGRDYGYVGSHRRTFTRQHQQHERRAWNDAPPNQGGER